MANALPEILRAASKHPNSHVSKLIHQVEEEPTQKNIVLLLIELAEHAEYSIDFNVSLRYYLDLFERLGIDHDLILNEAGLLLVNASKIYSKRVDFIQSLVERQILTLSSADKELQEQKLEEETGKAALVEKPKRGRKRALEAPSDPYEVELIPKKFKKLTEEKRFALPKTAPKTKSILRNIEMEQQVHPAGWQHAIIYDLENEEDVDTKRNYKLFTYHVEHRYNTLVPDINFRLHFKVKDYMDEQEEMTDDEACDRSWPPLSEAYVQKYLRLENYVLQQNTNINNNKEKQAYAEVFNKDPANESQQNFVTCNINESISGTNKAHLEQFALDSSVSNTLPNSEISFLNKTQGDLDNTITNEKNDSGLGQSMLSETNDTLESSQLNCILETPKNVNSILGEANLYSSLDANVLHRSSNMENHAIEHSGDLNTSANKDTQDNANISDANNSFNNVTDSKLDNDSALANSVLDQTCVSENNTSGVILSPQNAEKSLISNVNEEEEVKEPQQHDGEKLIKATDNRRDSVLSSDNTESVNKIQEKTESKSNIDVAQQPDKKSTQIRVHLPNADDEGVYFDLDERDCHLLSPVIKATNILPGIERKDITIIMDEELRQALEMRDNIMKHFSHETYKVPVITEEKKQSLIFNILKLPEKMLRRKVLFKLGPEMDLYIQARSLKRCRHESMARVSRKGPLLQWYYLNNTDMSDVFITPPSSPGHSPDFCGFPDSEDDRISCAEFCGFTEEEQSALIDKPLSRLSRDSGVGVDVNNTTPDKETLEIVFEDGQSLATKNGKKKLNSDNIESTESLLEQLPSEIRNILTLELNDIGENTSTTADEIKNNTSNNTKQAENVDSHQGSLNNSDAILTENCSANDAPDSNKTSNTLTASTNTKNSEASIENSKPVITENSSLSNTEESAVVLTDNSSETLTEQSTIASEALPSTDSQLGPLNVQADSETSTNLSNVQNTAVKISGEEPSNAENNEKSAEQLLKVKLDLENNDNVQLNDSDDVVLDLNTQGNKTKIQKWHEHLQPILAKSRERHHFDVYKLGTEIIDTIRSKRISIDQSLNEFGSISPSFNKPVASFHDIMNEKDKSYVSRYFLSTLLLANQSNIEIMLRNKSTEQPSSWNDINLKLLSTKRHTVAIEDNIGMINSKQKPAKGIQNNATNKQNVCNDDDLDEDEPLVKLQRTEKLLSTKLKPHLKRTNNNSNISCISEKKNKEIPFEISATNIRPKKLPNLNESVQIIRPPFSTIPSTVDTSVMPSTSFQTEQLGNGLLNVNINTVRTLQPIEKVQKRSDEHDSGIFSIDESMSTS